MPNLSNAQLTALKNNILANPNVSAWVAGGVDNSVKDWYNQNTVTMAWKSSFSSDDLLDAWGNEVENSIHLSVGDFSKTFPHESSNEAIHPHCL